MQENTRSQCSRRLENVAGTESRVSAPVLQNTSKNAILDLVYAADDIVYPLFRFVLTLEVVNDIPCAEKLKQENERTADEIENLKERAAEATDFLLVSTPTLDLGRVDPRKGTEFSFRIQNCSRTAAIPFVVAPNLASERSAIRSTPGDLDVKLEAEADGQKRTDIVEVPDVR